MTKFCCGCLVVKHSWKGKYKRIIEVTQNDLKTYNPSTFEETNSWPIETISNAQANLKNPGSNEFSVTFKKANSKSSQTLVFSTPHCLIFLTELLKHSRRFYGYTESTNEQKYNGSKLLVNGKTRAATLIATCCGLERWNVELKKRVAVYYYKDIDYILNVNGLENAFLIVEISSGFKRCFIVNNYDKLIQKMKSFSDFYLGKRINIMNDSITTDQFHLTMFGIYSDDENMRVFAQFPVFKISENWNSPIQRTFSLSDKSIIEHDPDTYHVIAVKPLKNIHKIIRCKDNPQKFGIEYASTRLFPVSYYTCAERDSLLATLLDVLRMNASANVYIEDLPSDSVPRFFIPGKDIDKEVEILQLKLLGELENIKFKVKLFNNNTSYNGLLYAEDSVDSLFTPEKKQKMILGALNNLLNLEKVSSWDVLDLEQYFQCLRRMFATKHGYEIFTTIPDFIKKLGEVVVLSLRRENENVIYAAVEMLNSLMHPMHANYDLYYEQRNKMSLLASEAFIKSIIEVLRQNIKRESAALIICSILDFFTYALCQPYSDTTDAKQFVCVLKIFVGLDRLLFKLFLHPSGLIKKSAGMLMEAIINEADEEMVSQIQKNALAEGIFPRYFLVALYTDITDTRLLVTRQLSRRLLALWLQDSTFSDDLLRRTLPIGLLNFLHSDEVAQGEMELEPHRNTLNVALKDQPSKLEVKMKQMVNQAEHFLMHWQARLKNTLKKENTQKPNEKRILVLRNTKENLIITYNWDLFYQRFNQDHYLPGLIWNHKTREELKEGIEAEIRAFSADMNLSRETSISWNYSEFEVVYASLQNELKIGDYYIKPLLDLNNAHMIFEPAMFFNDLYHVFLQTTKYDMKLLCLQALSKVYSKHVEAIGDFNDLKYLVSLLLSTKDRSIRDRIILLVEQLVKNKNNCRRFIECGGLVLLADFTTLAHLHTSRAKVPLQKNMIESGSITDETNDIYKEWYINNKKEDKKNDVQAYSFSELQKLFKEGVINSKTKVWAHGMDSWKLFKNVSQLKWSCDAIGDAILNDTELAIRCLDILCSICSSFPSVDDDGGIVRPMPRVKRFLSDIRCLPHICQLMLTFEPRIVERVCTLVYDVMLENFSLNQLFLTGFFYFVMMYTGSNILPIAKFLKYAHTKQSYQLSDTASKNKIAQHSILSSILPDSLVCYLYHNDIETFSKSFLGNYETPEIIWNEEMRCFMIEKIALHLADFIPKLKSNVKSLYMYCPIPHIEYESLRDELFCGTYYLSHLCDEAKYPNWPIRDPVRVLRDILDAWKAEINKKPPTMSIGEALTTLELDPNTEHEDRVIRRAYFGLANKFHPDKNPDGRERFEAVLKAYEYLCSKEVKTKAPQTKNILLILKSQTILFKRCKSDLNPYKYPGYPMLIHTIKVESKDDDLFARGKNDCILLPATELCHYSIACSLLNAEELRREGGIEVLKDAMERCVQILSPSSVFDDIDAQVCANVISCFTASALFEGFRTVIFELPGYVQNLCHILLFEKTLPELIAIVCQCVIALCQDPMIQLRFLQMGIAYHLVYYLFLYDYTLTESGISTDAKDNKQLLYNEISELSLQCLSIMLEISEEHGGPNLALVNTFDHILTPYIAKKAKTVSAHEILKLMNTNHETPYYIWNNETRSEIIGLMKEIRKPNLENERENFELASNFEYSSHKELLNIGNVYVAVYNKSPNFPIENPDSFMIHLLSFISDEIKHYYSLSGCKSVSLIDFTDSEIRYQHLLQALEAVFNLIRYHQGIEKQCNKYWKVLFTGLSLQNYSLLQIQILNIIHVSVKTVDCVQAIENAEVLGWLLPMLHIHEDKQQIIFEIFDAFFTKIKLVKEALNKGILIYLLFIFCQNYDAFIRQRTANLFSKLISDTLSGPRIRIILSKFLPSIFLDAISDDVETAILLFENNQENPELIWNDGIRKHVLVTVSAMKTDFAELQMNDPAKLFKIDDDFSCFTDYCESTDNGVVLNGVYLRLFISQPGWVLRRPKEFLIALLDKTCKYYEMDNLQPMDHEVLEVCTQAFTGLLAAQENMADYIPQLGHISRIVNALDRANKANDEIISGSCVRCLRVIFKNSFCCQTVKLNTVVVPAIISCFGVATEYPEETAETLSLLFSHNIPELLMLLLKMNLIKDIVSLLSLTYTTREKNVTSSTKAHIVNALQAMSNEPISGLSVKTELDKYSIWKEFKHEKHDLFIEEPAILGKLTYHSSNVAGYLSAAHTAAPTAISSQTHNLLITQTAPPPPPDDLDEDD